MKLWINNYPTVFDLPETIASPITECVVAVYTLSGKRLFSWSPNKPGRIPEVMDLREMFERYPSGNYICTLRVNKTPLPSRRVYFMD